MHGGYIFIHPPGQLQCQCVSRHGYRWCVERATEEDGLCDSCRADERCVASSRFHGQQDPPGMPHPPGPGRRA